MERNDLAQISDELMPRLGSDCVLDDMMSSDLFDHQEDIYMNDVPSNVDDTEPDDVIILHMDIREPLTTLLKLVEMKLGLHLPDYKFCLQDSQDLEPNKNLVDQCVKGEGLVQINVQVRTFEQSINIVDVLKPTEENLATLAAEEASGLLEKFSYQDANSIDEVVITPQIVKSAKRSAKVKSEASEEHKKPCQNWVLDHKFKREQTRLHIPDDPVKWTKEHVQHWFKWAEREFELEGFKAHDWLMSGKELCDLTHQKFREKMPKDPGNIFWTHLQLLKQCKFVSIMHKLPNFNQHCKEEDVKKTAIQQLLPGEDSNEPKIMRKSFHNAKNLQFSEQGSSRSAIQSVGSTFGVGSGNNGQMQLWQFLLDILTDPSHTNIIQWVGNEGEFKLTQPEEVARLWGAKKNKPAMNYEKLSRALRYYYDGDMISKVSGKRFAYKFDCDLTLLIGYSAEELSRLVNEKPFDETVFLEEDIQDEILEKLLEDVSD